MEFAKKKTNGMEQTVTVPHNAKRFEKQNDVVRAMAGTVELAGGPAAGCWHRF
jgi:hypothetical protein